MCENSNCVVIVPSNGLIVSACDKSLLELEKIGYTVWRVPGYSAIDQARNHLASDALEAGYEETLWIDSDVGFHPADVELLRSHQLPLVCAIYPKKGTRALSSPVLPGTEKIVFGKDGGLLEILYSATGFLLVRKEAYQKIKSELKLPICNERFGRPVVPFFQPMVIEDSPNTFWYLGEDFAFSHRARQAGLKIYADTRIRLWHYGEYGFTWEDAGAAKARHATYHYNVV